MYALLLYRCKTQTLKQKIFITDEDKSKIYANEEERGDCVIEYPTVKIARQDSKIVPSSVNEH